MDQPSVPFEILEHPADVGFLAHGRSLEELFANAALAMMSLGWELDAVEERESREIEATGEDTETLLYDWLSAILAVADAERMVFRRFEVSELGEGRARGVAWGEPFDNSRHQALTYIKAVTFHQFEVRETGQGWTARVYVDV
jgi:SHS2 domain-containing protein